MCGIVGAVAERNVVDILLEGLSRLEYRGYDSSGLALIQSEATEDRLLRLRALGKVVELRTKVSAQPYLVKGRIGIAHTRWATHGEPAEKNAHPHVSHNEIALVHNGIIENYQALKSHYARQGYAYSSDTDTEVVAHAIYANYQSHLVEPSAEKLLQAVQKTIQGLDGAYALGVMAKSLPDTLIAARKGSPLVIGVGFGEYFMASDIAALLPVTQRFIYLEEGDIALMAQNSLVIYDHQGKVVERDEVMSTQTASALELNGHRHFMHKEIFEQPQAVINTLHDRLAMETVPVNIFGGYAEAIFSDVTQVQIISCGTSYHAGLVAKYWFEDILNLPCQVEVASEYRYRNPVVQSNTLVITISQSGETADTLSALNYVKQKSQQLNCKIATLSICNVPESSLTRSSDLVFLTQAGPEIGVASTKAFTTQLVGLALLTVCLGKTQKRLTLEQENLIVKGLKKLPRLIENVLQYEEEIKLLAQDFSDKQSAIFLGRGAMYPIAMEGALKLKEISYIHAEAYPAGELKHGPLALIDESMPVVAIAPHDALLEKLKSNLQEVQARGGRLYVFEDERSNTHSDGCAKVIKVTTNVGRLTAPITLNVALQLLSYHVALIKGTDVDQPRNLAKSVTVE